MAKIQPNENHKSKPISAKLIMVGVVAVLLFSLLLSSVIGLLTKYIAMRKHINSLKIEQSSLKQKQDALVKMNNYIETLEGKEYVFRDKYRLVKPGEQMIVIVNEEPKSEDLGDKKPVFGVFWGNLLKGLGLR